jgi:hypothetical protein
MNVGEMMDVELMVRRSKSIRESIMAYIHENGLINNGAFPAQQCMADMEMMLRTVAEQNVKLVAETEGHKAVAERYKELYLEEAAKNALRK